MTLSPHSNQSSGIKIRLPARRSIAQSVSTPLSAPGLKSSCVDSEMLSFAPGAASSPLGLGKRPASAQEVVTSPTVANTETSYAAQKANRTPYDPQLKSADLLAAQRPKYRIREQRSSAASERDRGAITANQFLHTDSGKRVSSEASLDALIAQLLVTERPKVESSVEGQIAEKEKEMAVANAQVFPTQRSSKGMRDNQLFQLSTQAEAEVVSETERYNLCMQEEMERLLKERNDELQSAQATFQSQCDQVTTLWETKAAVLESAIQAALNKQRDPSPRDCPRPQYSSNFVATLNHVAPVISGAPQSQLVAQGIARLRASATPQMPEPEDNPRRGPPSSLSLNARPPGVFGKRNVPSYHISPSSGSRSEYVNTTSGYIPQAGLRHSVNALTAEGTDRPSFVFGQNTHQENPPDTLIPHVVESKSGKFLVPRLEQRRDPALIPVQRAIRKLMQRLLGIQSDRTAGDAVRRGHATSLKLAKAFPQPTLVPFRPCWDDIAGDWNQALGQLFVESFKLEHPQLATNETYIRKYFLRRLRTLREAMASDRHQQKRISATGRKHSREETNVDPSDGSYPILLLYRMVKLLGTDGMSSDSSDDGRNYEQTRAKSDKIYTVRNKNWRHPGSDSPPTVDRPALFAIQYNTPGRSTLSYPLVASAR
ncbi:hypothetical protein R3P38DRAFT_2788135 [Favolaschia claudopus]|uniref:Uncharacterized protein n=1 Tax=Favolaschia claudopus TaxID=2862362 RepID=A0AAW0AL16_9AGAR